MPNEIRSDQPGLTGSTLYAMVLDPTGQAYNGTAFAAISAGSWASYAQAMAERTGTGVFLGDFPAVAAGRYGVTLRKRVGGAPATTDPVVASGSIDWSGSAPIVPAAVGSAMAITDKTGFKLASDGLNSISVAPAAGDATNFREMMVAVWRRWFRKATKDANQIKTYADNGTTVLTTQAIAVDIDGNETQGAAT